MRTHGPALLALLLASACQLEVPGTLALGAELELGAAEVDFGAVGVGDERSFALPLRNRGQVPLQIEAGVVDADAPVFALAAETLFVDVGAEVHLTIVFTPDRPQAFAATLRAADQDDPALQATAALLGTGLLPDCDDANTCTEDRFDLEALRCEHRPVAGSCDDGRRCTEGDRCVDGACVGRPISCDDGVACTLDFCDETAGCTSQPDHAACADPQSPCEEGVCDPARGCLVQLAADGTLCGAPSCDAIQVCVQGTCRSGPAPDGFPCDDGDPCTDGDACQGGACVPGAGQGLAISTPVELEPVLPVSSYYPMNAVGVLAANVPASGGFEVVWVDYSYWQDVSVAVLRALYDADGTVVWSQQLAQAEQARAAFAGDDLILALVGCRTCSADDTGAPDSYAPNGGCPVQLRRYAAAPSAVLETRCLDTGSRYIDGLAVAAEGDRVALAYVEQEIVNALDPPGALKVRRFGAGLVEIDEEQVESWLARPSADYQPYPRGLQARMYRGEPLLAYERTAGVGYQGPCGYCDFHVDGCACDDAAYCSARPAFAAAASPLFYPEPLDSMPYWVTSVAMASRGLGLVPGDAFAMASWSERYQGAAAPAGDYCTMEELVSVHTHDPSELTFDTRVLAAYAPNLIVSVAGALLVDAPAALVLRRDGVLELAAERSDGAGERFVVPRPQGLPYDGQRAFSPGEYYPARFPSAAVEAVAGGFLAVAVTGPDYYGGYNAPSPPPPEQGGSSSEEDSDWAGCSADECATERVLPYRFAFFTAGCGVTLPPLDSGN